MPAHKQANKDEKVKLHDAMKMVPLTARDFWEQVASKMCMTASECINMYQANFVERKREKRKRRKWENTNIATMDISQISGETKKHKVVRQIIKLVCHHHL